MSLGLSFSVRHMNLGSNTTIPTITNSMEPFTEIIENWVGTHYPMLLSLNTLQGLTHCHTINEVIKKIVKFSTQWCGL